MTRRRPPLAIAVALVATLLIAACGSGESAASAPEGAAAATVGDPCSGDEVLMDLPTFTCEASVELANARIGWLHFPVTRVEFQRGHPCPPNARCRLSVNRASVIFHFWAGDPVLVPVTSDERGVLSAGEPGPWAAEALPGS